jgi:hypothetical protein
VKNWFKANPFTGGLAAATAVLTLAALYFAYAQNASFVEQTDTFAGNTASLGALQSSKPLPNTESLKSAEAEAKQAGTIIEALAADLAGQTAALDPDLTPRDFQDKLSAAAAAAETTATAAGVTLPEDFYLGFADYKAQPPPEAAAPMLGQQLETITNFTDLLLKSGIKQLIGIERAPLPAESEPADKDNQDGDGEDVAVRLAPFDVEFVADTSAFRNALSAIIAARPIVLIRLVNVTNSNPAPPAKASAADTREGAESLPSVEDATGIPVLFGKETLNVKLRLASVSEAPTAEKK